MLIQPHHGLAYFDCTAALGGNFAGLVLAAEPFSSWPAASGRARYVDLDSVERHKSSGRWQLNEGARGRHRSLNDENHACGALNKSACLTTWATARTYRDPGIVCRDSSLDPSSLV